MTYEWNPGKAASNFRKHGVSFAEAASVFLDPIALTFDDPDHSDEEDREITIGISSKQRVLFVAHLCASQADPDHQRAEGDLKGENSI